MREMTAEYLLADSNDQIENETLMMQREDSWSVVQTEERGDVGTAAGLSQLRTAWCRGAGGVYSMQRGENQVSFGFGWEMEMDVASLL